MRNPATKLLIQLTLIVDAKESQRQKVVAH
jgi:hypothetical protein